MRVDVLLVVGAGRDHVVRLLSEDVADAARDRFGDRRVALGHQRQHLHEVADLIIEFRALALQPVEDRRDFALHVRNVFFEQEAAVDA